MRKHFLLLCLVSVLFSACVEFGKQTIPVPDSQSSTTNKTHFSKDDLNAYRKDPDYYEKLNAKRNSHLPKGKPYTVLGKTYTPYSAVYDFEEIGIASWYGPGFHGKKTSNGETFNTNELTAAHKLLPFNTKVKVTNLENGKTVIVRINDRGPFTKGRIIDLSKAAATKLDMIKHGTAKVHIQALTGNSTGTNVYVPQKQPVYSEPINDNNYNFSQTGQSASDDVLAGLASQAVPPSTNVNTGGSETIGSYPSSGNSSNISLPSQVYVPPSNNTPTTDFNDLFPNSNVAGFQAVGIASWYGPGFHGKKTANGEAFNMNAMTAAHKELPFNTKVKVTNLENGKTAIVRINDRGPYAKGRIIDLSKAAATQIGMIDKGTAKVYLQLADGSNADIPVISENTADTASMNNNADLTNSNDTPITVPSQTQNSAPSPNSGIVAGGTAIENTMPSSDTGFISNDYISNAPVEASDDSFLDNQLASSTIAGQLYLHLAVFKDKVTAQKLSYELGKRKIHSTIFVDNGFYIVQAGPFQTKKQVESVKQYLNGHFPKSYLVVR